MRAKIILDGKEKRREANEGEGRERGITPRIGSTGVCPTVEVHIKAKSELDGQVSNREVNKGRDREIRWGSDGSAKVVAENGADIRGRGGSGGTIDGEVRRRIEVSNQCTQPPITSELRLMSQIVFRSFPSSPIFYGKWNGGLRRMWKLNSTQAERETGGEAKVETRERLVREENRRPPERHSVTPFYSWLLPERLQYYYNRVLIPFILYTKALFHFLPMYRSIHQLFTPLRRSLVIARISRSQCLFFTIVSLTPFIFFYK